MPDAGVLGDIAVGHMHHIRPEQLLQPPVERPPHGAHEDGITGLCLSLDVFGELDRPLVVSVVACFTQGHEVVRGIPAGLPALYVVDVEPLVFGFPFAAAAGMAVPEEDVFTCVPETEHVPLLVVSAPGP